MEDNPITYCKAKIILSQNPESKDQSFSVNFIVYELRILGQTSWLSLGLIYPIYNQVC